MALIDLSNYDTLLVQSSVGRAGTPDGNIFFDSANGILEIITVEEQATIDMTQHGGGASDPNPLSEDDGIRLEAIYAFENQERRTDENLRKFDRFTEGNFKFGGAYNFVNGRTPYDTDKGGANSLTGDDRFKLRGSGWSELYAAGTGRIYYGNKSLGNVEALSQPYYQQLEGGAPINYDKDGPLDESIKVYGDNAIDANAYSTSVATAASQTISVVAASRTFTRSAGDFESDGFEVGHRFTAAGLLNNTGTYTVESVTTTVITVVDDPDNPTTNETGDADEQLTVNGIDRRTYLSIKLRTFQYNYDEKVLADSGVTEMGGYFTGFALGESAHLTTGNYTLADVYGGAQIAPWTGMTLEKLAVAQTETGFNETDGDFIWVVNNTGNGNLDEIVAFLDALSQTDNDIDSGAITVTNGKRVGTWYSYNAAGKVVTNAPFAGEGLFLENVPTADKQRVVFTDDAGATKTYPFEVAVQVTVGAIAVADVLAWYHAFFLDGPAAADYNTAAALTVQDSSAVDVKGNVATDQISNRIDFAFDYDGDTIGGTAGTDKDIVFLVEGDGGATQAKTIFTITQITTVTATCQPTAETNV